MKKYHSFFNKLNCNVKCYYKFTLIELPKFCKLTLISLTCIFLTAYLRIDSQNKHCI